MSSESVSHIDLAEHRPDREKSDDNGMDCVDVSKKEIDDSKHMRPEENCDLNISNTMDRIVDDGGEKKNSDNGRNASKRKSEFSNGTSGGGVRTEGQGSFGDFCKRKRKRCEMESAPYRYKGTGLTCIGILPGICGNGCSSDDSDSGSSGPDLTEAGRYDLTGRRIDYVQHKSTREENER